MKEKNTKRLGIVVPPSLYDALKEKCDKECRNLSAVVKKLIKNYIEGKYEEKQG